MTIKFLSAGAAMLLAGLWAAGAAAQPSASLGVLTCEVQGAKSHLIEESKTVQCNYMPNLGLREHYTGTISKLGIGLGVTGEGVIAWDVLGTGAIPPGGLQGAYGKVPVRDGDAGPLLGGFENSVALNPVVEAGDGRFAKFLAGVGDLTLQPAAN